MAKATKNRRAQFRTKSAPKNTTPKENVNAKAKVKAKEKANDFRNGKEFDKSEGIAPENTPASGSFDVVLGLIQAARVRAVTAVNTTLIELYWSCLLYTSDAADE